METDHPSPAEEVVAFSVALGAWGFVTRETLDPTSFSHWALATRIHVRLLAGPLSSVVQITPPMTSILG